LTGRLLGSDFAADPDFVGDPEPATLE